MSVSIPSYLNKEFFIEALDETGSKDIVINDLKITRNTTGGNYCSDIYLVEVKYGSTEKAEKVAHLLVKDLFENLTASSREYFVYNKVLPEMNSILINANVEHPTLSPKLYLARKIKGETHVFENLNANGYKLCDRFVGFNTDQTKVVIEKLAKFHAASMIFKEKHPEVVDQLQSHFWETNDHFPVFVKLIIDGNIKYITDIISKWDGYEEIAKKMLHNTGKKFEQKFLSLLKKDDAKIRVITHADLWIKNILILEKEKVNPKVLDAIFIDYQICYESSPALDILNLFSTSVQLEVQQTDRNSMIEHYHKILCSTLNKCDAHSLGLEIPSLDQIHAEITRVEYFSYYALVFAFAQTNLSEELAQQMGYDNFFESTRLAENRENMFSNPRVLETLKFELKRLDQLGVLE